MLFQFPPELEQHNSPSERNVAQATSVSSYTNKRQNNKWASGNTYAIEKVDNAAAVRQVRRVEGILTQYCFIFNCLFLNNKLEYL